MWYLDGDKGESMMGAKSRYTKPVNNRYKSLKLKTSWQTQSLKWPQIK